MKFRKKPVEVEAIKYDGGNINDVAAFVGDEFAGQYAETSDYYEIETLEGDMTARPGDYIIQGVQGEFYPCKPDIFEATYEAVGE